MTTDLAESTGVKNPLVLLERMIEKGINPDQLGKMMDLAERWERNRAAEAFAQAVTGFQSECPPVFKGRQAKAAGNFQGFDFVSFDDVMRVAKPLLTKYAIVPTFTTDIVEREGRETLIKCTCRLRVGIHVEETTVTIPIPPAATKTPNNTHQYAQGVTYAKRYSFCAALNIVCTDDDNDATPAVQYATTEQITEINTLINACEEAGLKPDHKRLLAYLTRVCKYQIDNLENLNQAGVQACLDFLKGRIAESIDLHSVRRVRTLRCCRQQRRPGVGGNDPTLRAQREFGARLQPRREDGGAQFLRGGACRERLRGRGEVEPH